MIFAQKGDTLADIIGRVLESADHEVTLAVPISFEALREEEDFFRLFEEVRAAGKIVTIVSDDEHVRVRAKHIGFRVGALSGSAYSGKPRVMVSDIVRKAVSPGPQRIPFSRTLPTSERPLPPSVQEGEPILEPPRHFVRLPRLALPSFFRSSLGLTILLALVGLGIAGGVLGVVLPSVEVLVTPRTEELELDMEVVLAVNPSEGEIAAQKVEVLKTVKQESPATGTATVSERARGTVKIFNAHSTESQTLVANTRLVSQEGKLFRMTETVVVPGATLSGGKLEPSSIEVSVLAAEPGVAYNIGPSAFSIPGFQGSPKYQNFYGRSEEPMRGGASGSASIVQEEDIARANEGLQERATKEIKAEFAAKLPQGFAVLDEAKVETLVITTDAKPNDALEKVTATAQAKIEAMLFREQDVEERAREAIAERLKEAIDIVQGTLSLSYVVESRSFERGTMTLHVKVLARAARRIDQEALKRALAGKSEPEIRSFLGAHEDIQFAKVRFAPFFISKAPKDPARITIRVILDRP